MRQKTVEPFSAGYFLLDTDVVDYTGENAVMAKDYFRELTNYVTYPLIRIRDEHRWVHPEHGVPPETVAVPDIHVDEDEPVLMARDPATMRLVKSGEIEELT